MRRTLVPGSVDWLRDVLRGYERRLKDLERVRNPPPSYVEVADSDGSVLTAHGTSTIFSGFSTRVVAHSLGVAPESVVATARSVAALGVTARDAATFTVSRTGSTGDLAFDWMAAGTPAGPIGAYTDVVMGDLPIQFAMLDDASGTTATALAGNSGTYSGGPGFRTPGPSAAIPYGISVNGSSQYVTFANAAFPRAADGSYEVWFKTASAATTKTAMILRADNTDINEVEAGLYVNRPGLGAVSLYRQGADRATGGSGVNDDAWHHYVATVNQAGGTSTVYIDGVAVGSGAAGTPTTTNARLLIVGMNRGLVQGLPGALAAPAVYDYPLTASQVAAHYTAGS